MLHMCDKYYETVEVTQPIQKKAALSDSKYIFEANRVSIGTR